MEIPYEAGSTYLIDRFPYTSRSLFSCARMICTFEPLKVASRARVANSFSNS